VLVVSHLKHLCCAWWYILPSQPRIHSEILSQKINT
jgi:hypothetical protein